MSDQPTKCVRVIAQIKEQGVVEHHHECTVHVYDQTDGAMGKAAAAACFAFLNTYPNDAAYDVVAEMIESMPPWTGNGHEGFAKALVDLVAAYRRWNPIHNFGDCVKLVIDEEKLTGGEDGK